MSQESAILAWQKLLDKKQSLLKYRNALAGDGGGTVDVGGEPGFIWCRYSADQSKVSKVFNMIAPGIPEDFPIKVGRLFPDDEFEQVLVIDWTLYQDIISQDTVDNFTTGNHGESHNAADGADPAPIDLRNIIEMRGRAQAVADLTIDVERGQYVFGYQDTHRYPGETLDLTASVPGGAGHRYVLVYIDGVSNAAATTNSVVVPLAATPVIPELTANTIPICLVLLANGQTTITEDDIFDWRFLWDLVTFAAPSLIGTNAERLLLVVADLAELTRFFTTDTDKIWEIWEGAWRLIFPPAALSESDGDAGTPWTTDANGVLTGVQNLILDDGASNSPKLLLVGGSNDDQVQLFLDDDGVAGRSDAVLRLADQAGQSEFVVQDSVGNFKFRFNSEGQLTQIISDAVTAAVTDAQTIIHTTSGTAAAGFGIRHLWQLEDAGGATEDAAAITVAWEDAAAVSEDTLITFWLRKGGAVLGAFIEFGATENVFNEGGADIDFRVETSGLTHALFVEGGTNRIGIGESSPDAIFHVTASTITAIFERSSAGTAALNRFYNPDTTDVNGIQLAFFTDTDGVGGAAAQNLAGIIAQFNQHDHATRQSTLQFRTSNSGVSTNRLAVAPNGDVTPGAAKAQDLGSTSREWDVIYYVTATTGTSRLVDSTRVCPVCAAQMKRGTGTLNIQGEDADYALVFCLVCGVAGVEEWKHLPSERLSERRPPPMIVFEGMRVKSHGRSRTVSVDFRYGVDVLDTEGIVTKQAIRNSTTLSDAELTEFMTMDKTDRDAFLLQLGRREWDAREEQRIMRDERDILQEQLDTIIALSKGTDLLT